MDAVSKRLLSTDEAAQYLGISRANFYALGISGQLLNIGWGSGKNLYDLQDLDRLIENRKKSIMEKLHIKSKG